MKKYKNIFFDLDHTIWDYERNAVETLKELHNTFDLSKYNHDIEQFCAQFLTINDEMWILYRENKISRDELNFNRFALLIPELKEDKQLINKICDFYLEEVAKKPHLIGGAKEILDYLTQKRYNLYIVTNGHTKMQEQKIASSNIGHYFKKIYTSEHVGAKKPSKAYFEYAIKSSNAIKRESIVIGDSYEADILGAKAFGLDQIFYNPLQIKVPIKPTFEIRGIIELKAIL